MLLTTTEENKGKALFKTTFKTTILIMTIANLLDNRQKVGIETNQHESISRGYPLQIT